MVLLIKVGGNPDVEMDHGLEDVARLSRAGRQMVLVHGGSGLTDELSTRLGHPPRTITSPGGITSRYTNPETLRIYAMAVAGEINTRIVATLQGYGVNALGLSGVDGRLLSARRKEAIRSITSDGRAYVVRDDYTGQIERVNGALLRQLLYCGFLPVVAPLALGHNAERLNVDGDRAAAAIATELRAPELVMITGVPGLLVDPLDENTLIREIPSERLEDYMAYAQGRMRKKLIGAGEALRGGVQRVHIGNASLSALLEGAGTTISANISSFATTVRTGNGYYSPPTPGGLNGN